MSSSRFASMILVGTTLCVVALATASRPGAASPVEDKLKPAAKQASDPEPLDQWPSFGPDGSLFLAGTECGPDERLVPGAMPTCEPTCSNPRPICPKMFFASLDVVPCFCKAPLVRNEHTKQCVTLAECPKPDKRIPIQRL